MKGAEGNEKKKLDIPTSTVLRLITSISELLTGCALVKCTAYERKDWGDVEKTELSALKWKFRERDASLTRLRGNVRIIKAGLLSFKRASFERQPFRNKQATNKPDWMVPMRQLESIDVMIAVDINLR